MNFLVNAVIKKEHAALAACSFDKFIIRQHHSIFYIFTASAWTWVISADFCSWFLQMHFLPLRQDC